MGNSYLYSVFASNACTTQSCNRHLPTPRLPDRKEKFQKEKAESKSDFKKTNWSLLPGSLPFSYCAFFNDFKGENLSLFLQLFLPVQVVKLVGQGPYFSFAIKGGKREKVHNLHTITWGSLTLQVDLQVFMCGSHPPKPTHVSDAHFLSLSLLYVYHPSLALTFSS